ncbi:MAG: TIGR01777 family oxidoreductase [Deltaproteobacteria bacterium]|nr:TIGR01777 family oxidoreductase [Deltaproteobacteria bacterium]
MSGKVVVTGATGFLGRPLVAALTARGDAVTVLSRDAARARAALGEGVEAVTADLETPGAWSAALAGARAIVHLAGESVAGARWSARQKQRIRDSRVEATRTLVEELGKLPAAERPRALISTSGTDYYPFAIDKAGFDDDEVTEADAPAETFLGRVCRDWEREAFAAQGHGLRVAVLRVGIVLGRGGGALDRMTTPFKLFAGGRIGNGRQWVSWIHRDDVVAAYVAAVDDERYTGPINAVAASVRNADLARAIGAALHRPAWLPVPRFAVRAAAGELAEYLLEGRRVVPARLRELGFSWRHTDLEAAVRDCLA